MNATWDVIPSLGDRATSTFDEAEDVLAYGREQGWKRIIIVTDEYHTGRALYAFEKVFEGSGIDVEAAGAPNEIFFREDWWLSDRGNFRLFPRDDQIPGLFFLGLGAGTGEERLGQDFLDRFGLSAKEGGASGQTPDFRSGHSESLGDGSVQVLGFEFGEGIPSRIVGLAHCYPSLDSSARKHGGKSVGVMVASAVSLYLGGPPEFAGYHDHGRIEHPAVPKVGHQGGNGSIQFVGQVGEVSRTAVHGVPTAAGGDLGVADATLDEPAGEKRPCPKG